MLVAIPGAGANYVTGLVVRKGHSWNAEKDDFGPQIGLAWSPNRFKDKLAVRGGYGLNYNQEDRKSTRLNSSHGYISYAVFCLKKKNKNKETDTATCSPVHHI